MWPFRKKKEKKEKKGDELEGVKGKENKEMLEVSGSQILIRVYKHFGSNTSIMKAEYDAVERRDMYGNLISINTDYSHNEDTDFTMDDVYREINIVLELKNDPVEKKKTRLTEKINKQNQLLGFLKKYPILNAAYNFADESVKARDYKLLLNYVSKHDDNGAYFTIEKGRRVYSFESIDGFLVPIWHGVDNYTQYPDHIRKKKITIQEDQRMREEMAQYLRDKKIGSILVWGMVFVAVLILANLFTGYKLMGKYQDVEETLHGQAFQCAQYTSQINKDLTQMLENTVIKEMKEKQEQEAKQEEEQSRPVNLTPGRVIT